jgi:AcrR family transcriptional regulator
MTIEEKIITGTEQLFTKYGIKSVTMDDVARELGISKKTLYQHFSDKKDLVLKTFEHHLSNQSSRCLKLSETVGNPIEEILSIGQYISESQRDVNQSVVFDLKKYYPEAWMKFREHKINFVYSHLKRNMERGIKMGFYRSDMNVDIICKLYISTIDNIIDQELFPKSEYDFKQVYGEMLNYHLRGIASLAGINYLNEQSAKQLLK